VPQEAACSGQLPPIGCENRAGVPVRLWRLPGRAEASCRRACAAASPHFGNGRKQRVGSGCARSRRGQHPAVSGLPGVSRPSSWRYITVSWLGQTFGPPWSTAWWTWSKRRKRIVAGRAVPCAWCVPRRCGTGPVFLQKANHACGHGGRPESESHPGRIAGLRAQCFWRLEKAGFGSGSPAGLQRGRGCGQPSAKRVSQSDAWAVFGCERVSKRYS